jgi:23S rRNA (guanosine2251-2'-O)-methyltransferase
VIVILDNIRSALNVGSIIRTCDALGVKEIYFCGITPGPDSPKVQKTSLGAEKNIRPFIFPNTRKVVQGFKDNGTQVIGLELADGAVDVSTVKPDKELALVVGNEVSGISEDIIELCDQCVMIPMVGVKESLNVAVAFGIAAYFMK